MALLSTRRSALLIGPTGPQGAAGPPGPSGAFIGPSGTGLLLVTAGAVGVLPDGTGDQVLVMAHAGGTKGWQTLTGDASVSAGAVTVAGLLSKALPALPGSDQYLHYTGAAWAFSALPTSLPPTGTAGGDLSGTYPNPTVAKVNGANVPAAGSLTTGNVLQVTGASTLGYAAVNLAGGANFVTGTLPTANQANQAMGGDVTGTTAASTVAAIQGNTVTGGALTKGQFLVATSTTNWAATTLSGDISESATTAGKLTVVGLQGNAIQAATYGAGQDGMVLTWVNSASQLQLKAVTGLPSGTGIVRVNSGAGAVIADPSAAQVLMGNASGVPTWTSWSGDMTVASAGQTTVAKINGSSVPAGGSLTTGNVLQVNGASSLTYAPVNLAGGANYVTGVLPTANQANQAMGGDVTGTTAASVVSAISGTSPIAITPATLQWTAGTASPSMTQTAPASSSGAGTAGQNMSKTAQAGGATTGSATTGGVGGNQSLTAGAGGSGSGGTNASGGAGGNVNVGSGAGGAKSGTGTVGADGNIQLTIGAAGLQLTLTSALMQWAAGVASPTWNQATPASAATGTAGTTTTIASQTGGAATAGVGGAGGGLAFTAGSGGASTGTNANAAGGSMTFTAGAPGTGGSGAAGNPGGFTFAVSAPTGSAAEPSLSFVRGGTTMVQLLTQSSHGALWFDGASLAAGNRIQGLGPQMTFNCGTGGYTWSVDGVGGNIVTLTSNFVVTSTVNNVAFFLSNPTSNGTNTISLGNASAVPTTTPTNASVIYATSGNLHALDTSGFDHYLSAWRAYYGDGSDGTGTFDGTATPTGVTKNSSTQYTLNRDVFFTSSTVSTGVNIINNGFRFFVRDVLTLSGTSTIQNNGANASGTTGGPGAQTATLGGSAGGGNGGASPTVGGNTLKALGGNGGIGGNTGAAAGTATAPTAAQGSMHSVPDILEGTFTSANANGSPTFFTLMGGAGGGGGTGTNGGGGGGGGGVVMVAARVIKGAGSLLANGGNGANAGASSGGGGGGGGGVTMLVYGDKTGWTGNQSANGGSAGSTATGSLAAAGSAGTNITIQG